MGKIIIIIIFFCSLAAKGQKSNKTIVVVTEKDSVQLIKNNEDHFLKFYFLNNIKYNKSQKKQILSGGYILCEKCKKEFYSISVIPVKCPTKKFKRITTNDFLFKNRGYADMILFKNKYYKYGGRIID